jgi:hypothetical protein
VRREELQCNVVGISEGQHKSITCIDNSPILNSTIAYLNPPVLKRSAIGARECDVIQANLALIEF